MNGRLALAAIAAAGISTMPAIGHAQTADYPICPGGWLPWSLQKTVVSLMQAKLPAGSGANVLIYLPKEICLGKIGSTACDAVHTNNYEVIKVKGSFADASEFESTVNNVILDVWKFSNVSFVQLLPTRDIQRGCFKVD